VWHMKAKVCFYQNAGLLFAFMGDIMGCWFRCLVCPSYVKQTYYVLIITFMYVVRSSASTLLIVHVWIYLCLDNLIVSLKI
jgi:hypothetical protein